MVTVKTDNEKFIIGFDVEHIDTTNAPEIETEINEKLSGFSGSSVIIDAENLKYISSVGLRLVLKLKKQFDDTKIVNASTEVYEIFDMTGFAEMMTVEKAYKKYSVDGCEIIGEGAKGIVYRYKDDEIIKVYKNSDCLDDIQKEKELATKALVLGIDTAISFDVVKVGDKFASRFELLDAKSLSKVIAEDLDNIPKYATLYAELLRKIHNTKVKPEDMPSVKRLPNKWLNGSKGVISEEAWNKLKSLIDATPDTNNMIHGDYHTNNIMMQGGEPILIDMDTLSHGHPIFELANTYITFVGFSEFDPKNVEDFLGIPSEKAKDIWKYFLPAYLGTDDPEKLNDVEKKAKTLSYARIIARTGRMLYTDEMKKHIIETSKAKIEALLNEIDTFEF